MKNLAFIFTGLILLSSCASSNYFQVIKTTAEDLQIIDKYLVYEDENCRLLYNLWMEGGNIGFVFENKTNKTIHVNLAETFFIMNGICYDYYKNRSYTHSSSVAMTRGSTFSVSTGAYTSAGAVMSQNTTQSSIYGNNFGFISRTDGSTLAIGMTQANSRHAQSISTQNNTVSKGTSITYHDSPVISVAPHSAKIISEFNILKERFKNCETIRHPKDISSLAFTKENSPYQFRNFITYCLDSDCTAPLHINNTFFVSQISNMKEADFVKQDFEVYCGEKQDKLVKYAKYYAPDTFYIIYY